MSVCEDPRLYGATLSSKVALFNQVANQHIQNQAVNPFSNDCKPGSLPKPTITKEEYGRPARGSLSEARGFKASQQVNREMLELCDIIDSQGEPLFEADEKPNDHRKVISFGELFSMYTVINDKLVGLLLRARKHKFVDFEGECLFQRRDDHVPVILVKPIEEIRGILRTRFELSPERTFAEEGYNTPRYERSPEKICEEGQNNEGLPTRCELSPEKACKEESHHEQVPISSELSPEKTCKEKGHIGEIPTIKLELSSEKNCEEETHEEEIPTEKACKEETHNEEIPTKKTCEEKTHNREKSAENTCEVESHNEEVLETKLELSPEKKCEEERQMEGGN